MRLGKEDDKIWQALRDGAPDIESARAAIDNTQYMDSIRRFVKATAGPPERLFSDALAMYFKRHAGKDAKFTADVNRTFNFAKSIIGDPALSKLKRVDATRVLDAFLARNLKTASTRRNMAVLSAIYNVGILGAEQE